MGSYPLPSSTPSFAPPLLSAHQAAPKAPDLVQQGSEARQQAVLGHPVVWTRVSQRAVVLLP